MSKFIKILRACPLQSTWYDSKVDEVFAVEREEVNRRYSQGLPGDVYWVREGGMYNPLNWVLQADAVVVPGAMEEKHWAGSAEDQVEKVRKFYTEQGWDSTRVVAFLQAEQDTGGGFYGRLAAKAVQERDEADAYILSLWKNNLLPRPMKESLRVRLAEKQ